MLNLSGFVEVLARDAARKGWLAVIGLATFKPIGDSLGIRAVQRARDQLGELIVRSAPADAVVGEIDWITFAVFLTGATLDNTANFVSKVRSATMDDDLELEPGEWVEIRAAMGMAEIRGDGRGIRQLIEAAAKSAEDDLARFPAEWRYRIL